MDYITKYYKNKSEELQEKYNSLQNQYNLMTEEEEKSGFGKTIDTIQDYADWASVGLGFIPGANLLGSGIDFVSSGIDLLQGDYGDAAMRAGFGTLGLVPTAGGAAKGALKGLAKGAEKGLIKGAEKFGLKAAGKGLAKGAEKGLAGAAEKAGTTALEKEGSNVLASAADAIPVPNAYVPMGAQQATKAAPTAAKTVGSKVQGFFTPRRTIGGGLALGGVGSNVYGALAQPTTGMQQPNVQAQPTIGGQQQGIGQRNIDPRIQNIINLRAQYEKPTAR